MDEAVLPLLGYIILQIMVIVIGFNIVREREYGFTELLKSWVFGQMLCFAILQVLAVPMILLRWKYDLLFWSFIVVIIVLFFFGFKNVKKIKLKLTKFSPMELFLFMILALLILWQAGNYFFGMHLDEDDARWLAEANDALVTGDMMTRNFYTGEYIGVFAELKDVISPWPMLFAILSRVLFTRVSIVAHTIYPTIEIIYLYGVFFLLGKEIFQKKGSQLTFLIFTAIVVLFYGFSVYTQGAFILIRIWQGKASVAGIMIPSVLYLFICINTKNKLSDWLMLPIAILSGCLMSGMGIFISLFMVGVLGTYNIIAYQNWKRIPLLLLTIVPSLTMALTYYYLKG